MEVGVNAAIILEHIDFWCAKNKANDRNFNDGYYWTYNSTKAFKEIYPYMSEKVIRTALKRLVDGGYIVTGQYNERPYDRTKWYAVTEKGSALLDGTICPKGQMDVAERANGCIRKGKSHNISNSYKPVVYPFIDEQPSESDDVGGFVPPTLEEVREYVRGNMLDKCDPDLFFATYDAQGWVLGNGIPMTNWQSAVRKWHVQDRNKAASAPRDVDWSKYDPEHWERG